MGACSSSKQAGKGSQQPAAGEPSKTLHSQMQQKETASAEKTTAKVESSEPANSSAAAEEKYGDSEPATSIVAGAEAVEERKDGAAPMASKDEDLMGTTLGAVFKFDDQNEFFKAELERLVVDDAELKAAVATGGTVHAVLDQVVLSATNERSNAFLVKGPEGMEPVRVQVFLNANWPEELIAAVEAVTGETDADGDVSEAQESHKLADVFKFDDANPFFKAQVENLPLEDDTLTAALGPGGKLHKRANLVTLSATNERSNSFLVKGPVGEPAKVNLFLNEQWMADLLAAVRKVTDATALEQQQQQKDERKTDGEGLQVNPVEKEETQKSWSSFLVCCTQPSTE